VSPLEQSVEWNTAAQVMDMVDADVRREPAQDSRKVVVRTAMQGRFFKAPIGFMRLVLWDESRHRLISFREMGGRYVSDSRTGASNRGAH
jgi:hypothetical protein